MVISIFSAGVHGWESQRVANPGKHVLSLGKGGCRSSKTMGRGRFSIGDGICFKFVKPKISLHVDQAVLIRSDMIGRNNHLK